MKTREEYLIEYESKLVETLRDLYKSVNRSFFISYVLSALVVLVRWGSVSNINLLGAKITISEEEALVYVPILLSLTYVLIDYELIRIAQVYRQLNRNAIELLALNEEAKPITIQNVHLLGAGVTGLILSFSRWQANRVFKKHPFKFSLFEVLKAGPYAALEKTRELGERICEWCMQFIIRFSVTALLVFLPIVVTAYHVYFLFFKEPVFKTGLPLLAASALVLTLGFTSLCLLILFSSYFVDLIDSFKKDLEEPRREVRLMLKMVRMIKQFTESRE
jgi:hypothetical protein